MDYLSVFLMAFALLLAGGAYVRAVFHPFRESVASQNAAISELTSNVRRLNEEWDRERGEIYKALRKTRRAAQQLAEREARLGDGDDDGEQAADVQLEHGGGGGDPRLHPMPRGVVAGPWRAGRAG